MRRILLLLVAPTIIGALIGLLAMVAGIEWAGLYSIKLGTAIILAGGAALLARGVLQRWVINDLLDAVCIVVSVFLWATHLAGRMYFGDHSVVDETGNFRPIGKDEAIVQTLIVGTSAAIATAVPVLLSLVLLRRFLRK